MSAASMLRGNSTVRRDLTRIYAAAVSAVAPARLVGLALKGRLPGTSEIPSMLAAARRIFLVAVGKAGLGMAAGLVGFSGFRIHEALAIIPAVLPPEPAQIPTGLRVIQAAHPIPDASSLSAAEAAFEVASHAGSGDLFILALSGGASSLMAMPAQGVTLEDKIAVNAALLRSGAPIGELNVVRRHLSTIKGGGLLRAVAGAQVLSLILSDVAGNDLATIGSGPTAPDPSTFDEAVVVLKRHRLWGRAPESVRERLERGAAGEVAETVKRGDALLQSVRNLIVGDNGTALNAAAEAAAAAGYKVDRWRELRGEADKLGRTLGAHLCAIDEERLCLVAGGEPVVTVRGAGRGGRAQQAALAMAAELEGGGRGRKIMALFAGTDGIDGPTDAAGAYVSPDTARRAREAGFDPETALARNDTNPLFAALGDLLVTGPTGTNVSDIFIGLINY